MESCEYFFISLIRFNVFEPIETTSCLFVFRIFRVKQKNQVRNVMQQKRSEVQNKKKMEPELLQNQNRSRTRNVLESEQPEPLQNQDQNRFRSRKWRSLCSACGPVALNLVFGFLSVLVPVLVLVQFSGSGSVGFVSAL